MKNLFAIAAVLLVVGTTYFIVSPFLALSGLRTAIEEDDSASLEDRVDFPALRESLSAEFNAILMAKASDELAENPLGAIALGLATNLVEGLVNTAVTPAGLARFARGEADAPTDPRTRDRDRDSRRRTPRDRRSDEREPESRKDTDLFADARIEFETLSRFSAWVPTDDGDELRFVFRRRGLVWVLTALELPEFGRG